MPGDGYLLIWNDGVHLVLFFFKFVFKNLISPNM